MDDMQRQKISRLLSQRSQQGVAEATLQMWHAMAAELIPIIGEDGFAMLYGRSLYLTRFKFAWIAASVINSQIPASADSQYSALIMSLQQRTASEAAEASQLLFETFSDILVTLIGESLTTGILGTAWGNNGLDITSKGIQS